MNVVDIIRNEEKAAEELVDKTRKTLSLGIKETREEAQNLYDKIYKEAGDESDLIKNRTSMELEAKLSTIKEDTEKEISKLRMIPKELYSKAADDIVERILK